MSGVCVSVGKVALWVPACASAGKVALNENLSILAVLNSF